MVLRNATLNGNSTGSGMTSRGHSEKKRRCHTWISICALMSFVGLFPAMVLLVGTGANGVVNLQ